MCLSVCLEHKVTLSKILGPRVVCTSPNGTLMFILHEHSERSEHSQVKVIRKMHKNIAHPYMDGRACVCMSVCIQPKVKLSKILGG
jgi:hypothetical protein